MSETRSVSVTSSVVIGRALRSTSERPALLTNLYLTNNHISKYHAVVYLKDGDVFIRDTDSTFGTILNNVLLAPRTPHLLRHGDILGLVVNRPATVVQLWRTNSLLPADIPLAKVLSPLVHLEFDVDLSEDRLTLRSKNRRATESCLVTEVAEMASTPDYEDTNFEAVSEDEAPEEVKLVREIVINEPEALETKSEAEVQSAVADPGEDLTVTEPGIVDEEVDLAGHDDENPLEEDQTSVADSEDEAAFDVTHENALADAEDEVALNETEYDVPLFEQGYEPQDSEKATINEVTARHDYYDSDEDDEAYAYYDDSSEDGALDECCSVADDSDAEVLEGFRDCCGGEMTVLADANNNVKTDELRDFNWNEDTVSESEQYSSELLSDFSDEELDTTLSDAFDSCCGVKRSFDTMTETDRDPVEAPLEPSVPERPLKKATYLVLKEVGKGALYVAGTVVALIVYGRSLENQ